MTRDEFNTYIVNAADSTKAPEALAAIRDGVSELFVENEAAAAKAASDKQKIDELQQVNMRMFLRSGGQQGSDTEEEESLEEFNARMGKLIRGEE